MLRTVMNKMILSLAFFDLGYLVSMNITLFPYLIFDSSEWIFPNALCALVQSLNTLFFSGQILMYMAISLERFFVIVLPHFAAKYSTPRNGIIALATIWILATASAIPSYISSEISISPNTSQAFCTFDADDGFYMTYTMILVYVRYALPILLTVVLYIPMFYKLAKMTKRQHISRRVRNKRKSAVTMMLSCTISFIVCYTPQFLINTGILNQIDFLWLSFLLKITSCAVNPCCLLYFRWKQFVGYTQKEREEEDHQYVDQDMFRRCCQTNVNQMRPITAFMHEHDLETYEKTGFCSSTMTLGSIVNLHIDAAEMLFFVRNCKEPKNAGTVIVFLDEILDVYVGNSNNTKKKRVEESIKLILDSTYSKNSARCALTVRYGCDLREPKKMILVARSAKDAQNWCDALRNLAEVAHKKNKETSLYSWKRRVAAIFCKYATPVSFKTILADIVPFATEEKRNRWYTQLLRMSLQNDNKPIMELMSDEEGLRTLYAIILGRKDSEYLQLMKDADKISKQCQLTVDVDSMKQPLSHYYINSSHNTYLRDRQVVTSSSVSIYGEVLRAGCRCVELDCWNGPNGEPIIKHGKALTSGIFFKDVIHAIKDNAFSTSTFPVILSFENHCSLDQQDTMAKYCIQIFGNLLLKEPLKKFPLKPGMPLPSPFDLQRKILIKNKKVDTAKKPSEVSARLSALVNYAHAVSDFPGMRQSEEADIHSVLHSFGESTALKHVYNDGRNFIKHNSRQLSRIYPKAFRVDSSNFDPMLFWTAGCQMVALNLQTPGLPTQMNSKFFERNGKSGYVLKPKSMRVPNACFDPTDDKIRPNVLEKSTTFSIEIICGQLLGFLCTDVSNVVIKLETHGVNADRYETIVTTDFDEIFVHFRRKIQLCVRNMILPSLAMVHVSVRDTNDNILAEALLNICELRRGYHFLDLKNQCGGTMGAASLLSYITVEPFLSTALPQEIQPIKRENESENKFAKKKEPALPLIRPVVCVCSEDKLVGYQIEDGSVRVLNEETSTSMLKNIEQ